MSGPDKIDVRYVANLARLKLTDEEASLFQGQLSGILDYMSNLGETEIENSADVAPGTNELREDSAKDWFTAEEALRNAPRQRDQLFIVPKVVE